MAKSNGLYGISIKSTMSMGPPVSCGAREEGQMSAIIRFADHVPSQPPVTDSIQLQEEFDNINSPDTPLEQKLASALSCILQLQMKISDLQEQMAQSEREIVIKEMLLRNAMLRERELRMQMVGRFW
jgi:peptidoglycan hydrolase CwlO-like protein